MPASRAPRPYGPLRTRAYAAGALVLGALMLVTWGARAWRLQAVAQAVEERQVTMAADALDRLRQEFDALQSDLLVRARAAGAAADVRGGLQARADEPSPERDALVRFVARLPLPQSQALEVYDADGALAAWNGFSIPPGLPAVEPRRLNGPRVAVAADGDVRQALALWLPVHGPGGVPIGAIRAMQMLEARAPVQNQYLRDASLARTWQQLVELPVTIRFAEGEPEGRPGYAARPLVGLDGRVLGRVTVQPPPPEAVVARARARYTDVLILWGLLLFGWLVFGGWTLYRRARGGRPRALRLAGLAMLWWGGRLVLLALDVPARWQGGRAPLNPLFDPTHFASTVGGGLLRSTGDLLLTALFAVGFGLALVHFAARAWPWRRARTVAAAGSFGHAAGGALVAGALVGALGVGLAYAVRRVVVDSTLDYFARTGLFPERLVLVIFCAALLLTAAFLLTGLALAWPAWARIERARPAVRWGAVLLYPLPLVVGLALMPAAPEALAWVPWPAELAFLAVVLALAAYGHLRRPRVAALLTLRGVLVGAFLITALLYPMIYGGMGAQRRAQMMDVAAAFDEEQDPRLRYAIEQVLAAGQAAQPPDGAAYDARAEGLVEGSFLASLEGYDVAVSFLDGDGQPLGRYDATERAAPRAERDRADAADAELLREMARELGVSQVIDRLTAPAPGRPGPYVGFAPLARPDGAVGTPADGHAAWLLVRAEPHARFPAAQSPFPRALTPGVVFDKLRASLSVAEFRDGVFQDGYGGGFDRYRLAADVRQALVTEPEVWRRDHVEDRRYLTYYRLQESALAAGPVDPASIDVPVIAVRAPATGTFDHLYYLLRLMVAALLLGTPVYVLGLWLRRRAGLLPAQRTRFRDRVLNAFLGVGIVAVGAVGFAGVLNATRETGEALSNILEQDLRRVEQTLEQERQSGEALHETLDRVPLDSLAGWTGLDLLIYGRDGRLLRTSQPRLEQQRLVDLRLPAEAYHALFFEGARYVDVEVRLGAFDYRAGYRVLLNDAGRPQVVIGVPGIPDQERIEEERARQVAYVFGALLLLMVVVMGTAAILASALARPIGRLRQGLKAAGQGQFERTLPVATTDEIGDLVRTFNEMQEQLAESRRQLAQQERQLAWREMARQVAHEIKNPLTPMKLSVQHLRRAFDPAAVANDPKAARFAGLFDRITGTLLEQIDALKRIADEFHSFARMPTRVVERLDLNAVVEEAVALMQEEEVATIEAALHAEPLVVEADREELRRVYINLIKNAIQAVPEDRAGYVRVSTGRAAPTAEPAGAHGWAESAIEDNGIGIPPELHAKIFEPNFSTKTSGTGLGLAITQKAVEDLRGAIDFETEPDVGTTFRLRLPLAPAVPPPPDGYPDYADDLSAAERQR